MRRVELIYEVALNVGTYYATKNFRISKGTYLPQWSFYFNDISWKHAMCTSSFSTFYSMCKVKFFSEKYLHVHLYIQPTFESGLWNGKKERVSFFFPQRIENARLDSRIFLTLAEFFESCKKIRYVMLTRHFPLFFATLF